MRKYNTWNSDIWSHLTEQIQSSIRKLDGKGPKPVAAFDADGTLWDTDLGENFFRHQIKDCSLPGMPFDPWDYYRTAKSKPDPTEAYLWLAQINKGQKITQVREWADLAVEKLNPVPVFKDSLKLIQELKNNGFEIYIVTASVKWAVDAGAKLVGLTPENVIGVETEIVNGVVTDRQFGAMTYREGKVKGLLERTGGRKPLFACGNTMGDFALLESATELRLAVGASRPGEELWETESQLRSEAQKRKWMTHEY